MKSSFHYRPPVHFLAVASGRTGVMAAILRPERKEVQCPGCPLEVNPLSPRAMSFWPTACGRWSVRMARNCGLGRGSDKLPARQSRNRPDPDGEYFFSNTTCALRLL